ncbi:MAG: cation transporting ATPase C-terminal domain-containing protein [bacterium]
MLQNFSLVFKSNYSRVRKETMSVNIFIMIQLFYLFNCRSLDKSILQIGFFSNPLVIIGVVMMIVLQLLFTYAPVFNAAFNTAPLTLGEWGLVILFSCLAFMLVGVEKLMSKKFYS